MGYSDKTETPTGRRFLKNALLNPVIDKDELNNRYNLVESMILDDAYLEVRNILKNIVDIERLHRRMATNF